MTAIENYKNNLEKMVQDEVNANREKDRMLTQQSKLAAMGEMIGNIAHQWRQPLNSVGLIVQDFEDAYEYGELDGEYISNSITDVMKQLDYMSKTIDNFRDFFKPSKNKEFFDIKKSVDEVIEILKIQIQKDNVELVINVEDDIKKAWGYPGEFKQVLLNIINNSRDVFKEKGLENPKIEINIFNSEDGVAIETHDNGGGTPKDVIEKIFEPYFTTKFQSQGTGLGLYMSKMIIEKNMNGKLIAYNKDGGASFKIVLPVKES
jgi:signal transduction histidine kinase